MKYGNKKISPIAIAKDLITQQAEKTKKFYADY
jgi:hypothetical protein